MSIRPRGFTLLELLVATSIAVLLLSMLTFMFKVSTDLVRSGNNRVSIMERLRTANIRLSNELGRMLPVPRTEAPGLNASYYISPLGDEIRFSTTTTEFGKTVNVDLKYKFVPDPASAGHGFLVRYRDQTGPYLADNTTPNPAYKLGDDSDAHFVTPYLQDDIILGNVRQADFKFEAINPPPEPPPLDTDISLYPARTLPLAIRLTVSFGPENGEKDTVQTAVLDFPINRGI